MDINEMKAKFTVIATEEEFLKLQKFLEENNFEGLEYFEEKVQTTE